MSKVDALQSVISPALLRRTAELSQKLAELGIPHVLIGGLAVGLHGHPRSTDDVDFLVGEEAFEMTSPVLVYREELKGLVEVGKTDIMSVPVAYPELASELRLEEDVPVISFESLILMKLDAFRAKVQEDARVLLRRHPNRIRAVRDHLREHAPMLIHRLAEILVSGG